MPIQDVAWKTCRERWTIETNDERSSAARHDDDDDGDDGFIWRSLLSFSSVSLLYPSFAFDI